MNTVLIKSLDRNDIGHVLDDNTILLRFNDIFQIALIINRFQDPNCAFLFSILGTNPYEKFYFSIRKAFL